MNSIAYNLTAIRKRVLSAAQAAGRDLSSIRLIAVSKGHDGAAVQEALDAGQRAFGENRVLQAEAKFLALRAKYSDLQLHLIGPLQTNKAEEAVRLFDVIQTIDRPRLAEAVVKAIQKIGRNPTLYVEVNIGAEPQKAGVAPDMLGEFLAFCQGKYGLTISGLMCIPPQADDPAPHFLRLKQLADEHNLPHISIGMSADFETAVRCGATDVRIGSAIFGPRPKNQ